MGKTDNHKQYAPIRYSYPEYPSPPDFVHSISQSLKQYFPEMEPDKARIRTLYWGPDLAMLRDRYQQKKTPSQPRCRETGASGEAFSTPEDQPEQTIPRQWIIEWSWYQPVLDVQPSDEEFPEQPPVGYTQKVIVFADEDGNIQAIAASI